MHYYKMLKKWRTFLDGSGPRSPQRLADCSCDKVSDITFKISWNSSTKMVFVRFFLGGGTKNKFGGSCPTPPGVRAWVNEQSKWYSIYLYHSQDGSELPDTTHRVLTCQQEPESQRVSDKLRPWRAAHGPTGTVHQSHRSRPKHTRMMVARGDLIVAVLLCVDTDVHNLGHNTGNHH